MTEILVVDDEPNIRELVKIYLEKEGYKIHLVGTGEQAIAELEKSRPAMVILDIMLPDIDGFAICKEIRKHGEIPVIMLTARKDDVDKILGLELGADDYLTKPFNPRELVARVKAIFRRCSSMRRGGPVIEVGNLRIDLPRREVWIDEHQVKLRNKEFDLLAALAQNRGIVLTRERLLEMVWDTDDYGETRTVDIHIMHIREKISQASINIETVRGMGYKLVEKRELDISSRENINHTGTEQAEI
jgi:DNA-binding response OmpR family regulator